MGGSAGSTGAAGAPRGGGPGQGDGAGGEAAGRAEGAASGGSGTFGAAAAAKTPPAQVAPAQEGRHAEVRGGSGSGDGNGSGSGPAVGGEPSPPGDLSPTQCLASLNFWLLFVAVCVGMGAGLTFNNNLAQIFQALGGEPGGQVRRAGGGGEREACHCSAA